jgi:predicted nucleotidyltransferase
MRLPRFDVPDDRIAAFCRRWQIVELSLFGSVLREDFDADSDVDVLVQFAPVVDWSLLDLMTMQSELSTLLGRHVDLVEQAGLRNPFRRAAIIQSKHVVYAA